MGHVHRGLDVIEAVNRLVSLEGLERFAQADAAYLVVVGPAAWDALRSYGEGLGLAPGTEVPDTGDRVLGYPLALNRGLGGKVALAYVVGDAQAVPDA